MYIRGEWFVEMVLLDLYRKKKMNFAELQKSPFFKKVLQSTKENWNFQVQNLLFSKINELNNREELNINLKSISALHTITNFSHFIINKLCQQINIDSNEDLFEINTNLINDNKIYTIEDIEKLHPNYFYLYEQFDLIESDLQELIYNFNIITDNEENEYFLNKICNDYFNVFIKNVFDLIENKSKNNCIFS